MCYTEKTVFTCQILATCFAMISFRFRPATVKDLIHEILRNELSGKEYDAEEVPELTKEISEQIKDKLKGNIQSPIVYTIYYIIIVL